MAEIARGSDGGPRLVVATGNPGKLDEYRQLLSGIPLELIGFDTGVSETGSTYEENAVLKAEAASGRTGLPALGDDSGLEVEVLDGFPGVLSARLGATQVERNEKLFRRLDGRPPPWRAKFVCVIALSLPGVAATLFKGERGGEVLRRPRGTSGFGYDPIFLVPELGRTFAELDTEEKHRWSHRGAAVSALIGSGALQSLTAPDGRNPAQP